MCELISIYVGETEPETSYPDFVGWVNNINLIQESLHSEGRDDIL